MQRYTTVFAVAIVATLLTLSAGTASCADGTAKETTYAEADINVTGMT